MNRTYTFPLLLAVAACLTAAVAVAQPGVNWRGGGGWGWQAQYVRMYDPATVETLHGMVEAVEQLPSPRRGMTYGIHLRLKTERETISVHLGPAWFIERLDMVIEPGDEIEVKGSRVAYQGQQVIIAAEIEKGEQELELRDDDTGFPVWAGWRRR